MSETVISAVGLSKRYRLGRRDRYKTFRESVISSIAAPFKRLAGKGPNANGQNSFWALNDVNFDIKQGEVVGVIGRNGAGKSTLLKILSRVTAPTSGYVEVAGRVGSLLEVGTGFHPELSGRENIYLNGAILGMPQSHIRKVFDQIVAFAEVERFIDTPVKHYSSGMYTRLAFAVAAHLEPDILVIDEVLAVGDAAFQKKCLGKMGSVAKTGRTVIFVSHNMTVLKNICVSACLLDKGRLLTYGPAGPVIEQYLASGASAGERIVEITQLARPASTSDSVRFERLEWVGDWPVKHEGRIGVRFMITVKSLIEDLVIGLGFANPDGTRLLTYESDMYGPPKTLLPGQYIVEMTIPSLPLPPGFYNVDIGARSGAMFPLEYHNALAQIEVVVGERTPTNLGYMGAGRSSI